MLKRLLVMAGLILGVTSAVVPGDPPPPICLPCAR
jgi:hypothetical protein